MQIQAATVADYLNQLPDDRRQVMEAIRRTINENIPHGFQEGTGYGMMGWFVPHSLYPKGYHCDPKQPLPFASLAAQKNFFGLYHMGLYADEALLNWFQEAYAAANVGKLDMGKSCIRFKHPNKIPYDVIGALMQKMTPQQWIDLYESKFVKK